MAENQDKSKNIIVFVDTNYLRTHSSGWKQLLLLSQKRKIQIFMPNIVREEWRSGQRDDVIACKAKTKTAIRDFKAAIYQSTLIKHEIELNDIADKLTNLLPDNNIIEEASQNGIKKFIEDNKIKVINNIV